ncbi:acyltransferase, WS/DGAT/MGAT [Sinosporangium album]|uniref:Diacylglycerol O-acyltransferase n=1 Tax=Sinosporangium album TaxID=504805 RepID=A0A1G7R0M8_9ACTN|nr:wax ester/triacylglycerol synthase family O-acyltransferase [Sinosporangium album]SDG04287.1 acyltransferase, WS/DGAT/MGAT [Sinosporangium album]
MRQLTALDAQFLHAESPTTAVHVAGLAILDPSTCRTGTGPGPGTGTVTRDGLIALLRQRVHLSPALCMRLADVPLSLDHPYWVHDTELDVAAHVYESTLPAPGGQRELADLVAQIHERRLDRSRPLWEIHLIHGLAGGRVAVYTKVHHSVIDGVTGAETLAALLDLSPKPRTVDPPGPPEAPEAEPDRVAMLAEAVVRTATHPVRALRSLTRAAADLDAIPLASSLPGARFIARATRLLSGHDREVPELPDLSAPRTPLDGVISGERRFSYGSLPLAEVKRVAKAFGLSVNDVVMTLCSSALRAWLRDRDALPDQPLIAAVPVAVRKAACDDAVGNSLSAMITPLATDVACPRERLAAVGENMRTAKRRFATAPATWLSELTALLPAPILNLATPAMFRLAASAAPAVNLIVSNVPGPQFPLYLCGARVLAYHPISALSDVTGGVNITCFSYNGSLDFGVLACPTRMDDVWELLAHLRDAMEELSALVPVAVPVSEPTAAQPTAQPTVQPAVQPTARPSAPEPSVPQPVAQRHTPVRPVPDVVGTPVPVGATPLPLDVPDLSELSDLREPVPA